MSRTGGVHLAVESEPAPANRYIREVLHAAEAPPPITVRFFYTSPLAIDDPLSPLPPPLTGTSTATKQPPRPFAEYDNEALNRAWLDLRRQILELNESGRGEKRRSSGSADRTSRARGKEGSATVTRRRQSPFTEAARRTSVGPRGQPASSDYHDQARQPLQPHRQDTEGFLRTPGSFSARTATLADSLRALDAADLGANADVPLTTGNPFIRAPSRTKISSLTKQEPSGNMARPPAQGFDSYNWDDDNAVAEQSRDIAGSLQESQSKPSGPSAKVPVGVSRLHNVVIPQLQMEPIYWLPVHDVAPVIRGTWFYKENMLPVEVEVANMLEVGYVALQPWTETWRDELNSAVEVGAIGEMKILHRLWPEIPKKPESRPGTSRGSVTEVVQTALEPLPDTPEKEREETVAKAEALIDVATGADGPDNKAAGSAPYGRDGQKRLYLHSGIIYANEHDAYILRPSLQPSAYYGRRPLANYIRKGRNIGIRVVRGFDQAAWDKLHPPKKSTIAIKANQGVSTAQAGAPPTRRQKSDPTLALSERPEVTDLVLVIHGIGQKLSERVESFHFTHAINAFRREVNVELGTDSVKAYLRTGMGGVMVLPVNWRLNLSFEHGGYRDETEDPAPNQYSLKDITPETLPSVRNIISDVMLDIPYYLSQEHNPKVIAACIREANRIYRLWCANNPGFAQRGRVHLIAHSLGSVMAVDILSRQPTHIPANLGDPSTSEQDLPTTHFIFDTKSLFVCGSPVGFFLLLKRAALLPRRDRNKPGAETVITPGVAGEQDTYGCLAVDNIYNVINPYDPVAYRLNATVDAAYSAALKPTYIPSASMSWFSISNPFRNPLTTAEAAVGLKPTMQRMPSNVELETHNFTREEIAEERAYLLNDNGQIDFFLRYGGGPLEIQYLTMLGAHSSYWISRDFVRMIVVEVGRPFGREGTVPAMRAVKRKSQIG